MKNFPLQKCLLYLGLYLPSTVYATGLYGPGSKEFYILILVLLPIIFGNLVIVEVLSIIKIGKKKTKLGLQILLTSLTAAIYITITVNYSSSPAISSLLLHGLAIFLLAITIIVVNQQRIKILGDSS